MYKVRIIVICGSGVATSMHAAYKLREYFEKNKVPVVIDGGGNNELAGRIVSYDIVVSNSQVTVKTDKPVFSAIPLLTGIGEKELMAQVLKAAKEIIASKG
ncbi:MAG: PTS sugar transporter subunit IIB [Acidobacteriota bacterium]